MSSETITSAIFLVTAIAAAALMISAVLPVISQASSTFSENTQVIEDKLRTDLTIASSYCALDSGKAYTKIYIKNTGTAKISYDALMKSSVFFGTPGHFEYITYSASGDGWKYTPTYNQVDKYSLDPKETILIEITAPASLLPDPSGTAGKEVYFALSLPNGYGKEKYFTVSERRG